MDTTQPSWPDPSTAWQGSDEGLRAHFTTPPVATAALLVVREGGGYESRNDRYIDLRVDDHPEAPAELARVFTVWDTTMLIRTDESGL